jgi:hypothetical protein
MKKCSKSGRNRGREGPKVEAERGRPKERAPAGVEGRALASGIVAVS